MTPPPPPASRPLALADQAARDRIRSDLGTTLVVEAAAGTGKTTALVGRIVAALVSGRAQLDRIVAVTFTELAAGELKLRLRAEIERARRAAAPGSAAARHLTDALPRLEEARIGTIHSFCCDLLRERPVEARIDPLFEVAPEDVAGPLKRAAFERWFQETLADPPEGVRRVLRRHHRDVEGPRELLRSAADALIEHRDFPAPWRRDPFDRVREIDALLEEMAAVGRLAAGRNPRDFLTRSLLEIERFTAEIARREAIRGGRDYDGLEAALIEASRPKPKHWGWSGFSRGPDGEANAPVRARRNALHERLLALLAAAGADLAPRLRKELWPVVERYGQLKARAGKLDFLDLLLLARNLLRDDGTVRRDLQERFTHVFVDEFQDTDPLQAEILLLLAAADPDESDWLRVAPVPGKLFLVADPKQSIYRFRRADVGLYEAIKRRLVERGAEVEHLTVSFRAVPTLHAAVNAAFAPCMTGASPSQASYVPLASIRPDTPGQPALVALPVPRLYGEFGGIVNFRIDDSLPDAVAAFVDWLVHTSGWTVTERGDPETRVPIEARHVCLLFRRFRTFRTDVTHAYVRALEARHLPHVLVGGSSFHGREEVEAIRNALAAIERPDDDLAVFATLRGPLFGLDDGALLAFREAFGTLHPFRRLPEALPAHLVEVAAALELLRTLHRGRNRRPLADTIGQLLAKTRAHAGFAIWPTGEQALANVMRLMDLARRAERAGASSFRWFVERLFEDAERGEASDAPIIEEGTGGVRLMTVHRAKGLEFPVVILADLTAKEAPQEPSRYTDPSRQLCALRLAGCAPPELLERYAEESVREREEAARILYVAATRARDLLVVPAAGDGRHESWVQALYPAVYPAEATRRQPQTRTPAGCPGFGQDTVIDRPERVVAGRGGAVAPGFHRAETGTHDVVWWDPAVLELGVEESVGLRQQRLLEADEQSVRVEQGRRAHAAWQEERTRIRALGTTPTLEVSTATAWAEASAAATTPSDGPDATILVEDATPPPDAGPRPHGKRFGTLVHAVLAAADLDADRAALETVAVLQGRILGAPADEIAAAVAAATRALAHPLLRRAAAAARGGRCRREVPITLAVGARALVEGVVDVAFRDQADGDAWTVVDFKTDLEIAGRLEEYRRQVEVYARAIARASGLPARGVLLRV